MNASYFISRKIIGGNKHDYFRNILFISIATIAFGVTVMIISIFILNGFKHTIEKKVIGFIGDVRILPYTENESLESPPISIFPEILSQLRNYKNLVSLNSYACKAGIIKTANKIEGVVLYGVGPDFNQKCFSGDILEGYMPSYCDSVMNDSVVVSKVIADKLSIRLNDKLDMYFVNDETPRIRRFIVAGIYESGFNDYDKLYVISDINQIRRLNMWNDNDVTGYQIFLKSKDYSDDFVKFSYSFLDYRYAVKTYKILNPQVFDWLRLQDMNVVLLISLMVIVCIITMISILIIIIIEKTSMIGVLKALGMNNKSIRTIFLHKSLYLTGIGILIGDTFALFLSFLQNYFGLIKLSQESYYMNTVPVEIDFIVIVAVDLSVIIFCILSMVVSVAIIARINPVKAIQSE